MKNSETITTIPLGSKVSTSVMGLYVSLPNTWRISFWF